MTIASVIKDDEQSRANRPEPNHCPLEDLAFGDTVQHAGLAEHKIRRQQCAKQNQPRREPSPPGGPRLDQVPMLRLTGNRSAAFHTIRAHRSSARHAVRKFGSMRNPVDHFSSRRIPTSDASGHRSPLRQQPQAGSVGDAASYSEAARLTRPSSRQEKHSRGSRCRARRRRSPQQHGAHCAVPFESTSPQIWTIPLSTITLSRDAGAQSL